MSDTEIADVSQSLVDPVEKTQDRDDQDQRSDPSLSEVEENPSPEESRAGEDYSDSSSTQEGEDHDHDDDEENHFLEDLPKETPISTTSPKDGAGPKFRRKKRKISSRPTAVASKKSPPAPVPKLNLEYEKYLKGKAIEIKGSLERAAPDPLKDIETFRRYAIARSGLVSDDLRRKIWPLLASIAISNDANLPSQEDCEKHPEYNQVVLDVNRSLKRFPPGIAETERPGLQDQLTRLIVRVLLKHPHLHYYQGYHDVAITFLLVVGEEMGYHIMEKLSMTHLQSYMAKTMEETTYLLNYMYPIIRQRQPGLHDFMETSEVGTIFALPWVITWFGHVLPDYEDVVRLYDFFLCQPPLMPVYLASALVLHRKDDILSTECDLAMVHSLLSRIPFNLPFEKLLIDAQALYEDFPPKTIEKEVKKRVEKIKLQNRPKKPADSNSGLLGNVPLVATVIIVTAPIVLGVLAYRWYYTMH